MSTPQPDRKPKMVSTWFSSLRRQSKPKKVIVSKKHLQKSCVDLTSVPTDSKSLPVSVANSPKLKNGFFRDHHFGFSPSKSSSNGTAASDSDTPKRTYSTASSQSSGSNDSNCQTVTTTKTTNNGKTLTTITRVIRTTVVSNVQSNNRINHIGSTIFDDDGKLISNLENLDVYKNYANNFRSNIIKNDNTSSCSSGIGSHIKNIHVNNNNNNNNKNHCNTSVAESQHNNTSKGVRFLSFSDDDSGNLCKLSASNNSIANRPFKSNSLDDDIEFIDTSSSLSDIGASDSVVTDFSEPIMYYNTLPKLPKSCATCKTQKQQNKSKSDWNITIHKKVELIGIYFHFSLDFDRKIGNFE